MGGYRTIKIWKSPRKIRATEFDFVDIRNECPSLVTPSIRITKNLLFRWKCSLTWHTLPPRVARLFLFFFAVEWAGRRSQKNGKTRGTSLSRTIIEKSRDCLTFGLREDMWSRDIRHLFTSLFNKVNSLALLSLKCLSNPGNIYLTLLEACNRYEYRFWKSLNVLAL